MNKNVGERRQSKPEGAKVGLHDRRDLFAGGHPQPVLPSMLTLSITFDATDGVLRDAAREASMVLLRRHFGLRTTLLAAASAAIFWLALVNESHPLWLIGAGLAPALFALTLMLGWLYYLAAPRLLRSQVKHLPNRRVTIDFADSAVRVRTASEDLSMAWSAVKGIESLPCFWLLQLRTGTAIPVPKQYLPAETVALLQAKAAGSAASGPNKSTREPA